MADEKNNVLGAFNIQQYSRSGDRVTISLSINAEYDAGSDGIGAFKTDINFNPTILDYVSGSAEVSGMFGIPNEAEASSGSITMTGIKSPNYTEFSTPVATLSFDIEDTSQTASIYTSDVTFEDIVVDTSTSYFNFGSLTLSGTIKSVSGYALPSASVTVTYGSSSSEPSINSDGTFTADIDSGSDTTVTASLDYKVSSKAITSLDALDALKLSVGLKPSSGTADAYDFIAADFNQDGKVTSQDALDILKNSVGLSTAQSPKWVFIDGDKDYSSITKNSVTYSSGVSLTDVSADATANLKGILIGDVNASYVPKPALTPTIVFSEDFTDVNLEQILAKNLSYGSLTSHEPYAITREPTEWNTSQTSFRGKNGDLEYFWNDPFNEGDGEYLILETNQKIEWIDEFTYQLKFDLGFFPAQMVNEKLEDELTFTARLKFGETIISEKTINYLDTAQYGTSSVLLTALSDPSYTGEDISIEFTALSNRGFLANNPANHIEIDNVSLSRMHPKFVSEPGFVTSGPINDSVPLQKVTVTYADSSSWIEVKDDGLHRYFADDELVSKTQFTETHINSEVLEAGFSDQQTIWIDQNNAVRKVIKYRSPLHNEDNSKIAREDLNIVSPYGAGDWAEETLIVYPDGIVSRTIQIWSNAIQNSYAGFHAWNENKKENPGSTVFEVHERVIHSLNKELEIMDVFGTKPVILVDSEENIFQPDWIGSPKLYEFENPVAELIDLDFTDQTLFAILPAGNTVANKYQETIYENTDHYYTNFHDGSLTYTSDEFAVPLSQLENLDFFEKLDTTATQTYLQGLVNGDDAIAKVMNLQKSWQNPAHVEVDGALNYISFSQTERAYCFELLEQNSEGFSMAFQASPSSPVDGLVIKIEDWDPGKLPILSSTQVDVELAKFGIENEDELLVWLPIGTSEEFIINIEIM